MTIDAPVCWICFVNATYWLREELLVALRTFLELRP